MYRGKKVSVIIAAGGSGNRLGEKIPKQFIDMGGRSMLSLSVDAFVQNQYVDDIVLVVPEGSKEKTETIINAEIVSPGTTISIVYGGSDRAKSVRNGLNEISGEGVVLVHDAARPYVTEDIINRVIEKAFESGAAIPAVSVKDTIYKIDDNEKMLVSSIPDRSKLYAVQTPQGFEYNILMEAHDKAFRENVSVTDDGMPVMNLGLPVSLVEGGYENKKITTPDDLDIPGAFNIGLDDDSDAQYRVGSGFDVHKFEVGRKLILGGIEIPFEKGLAGHSDADVLTHALMDAILGALSLGDIGEMFPDNDDTYLNISSIILLKKVIEAMKAKGYNLINTDITIIAERPKMSSFKKIIENNLAEIFGVDSSNISVKATTTEKLGFTGREDGIGAQCVVLIKKF